MIHLLTQCWCIKMVQNLTPVVKTSTIHNQSYGSNAVSNGRIPRSNNFQFKLCFPLCNSTLVYPPVLENLQRTFKKGLYPRNSIHFNIVHRSILLRGHSGLHARCFLLWCTSIGWFISAFRILFSCNIDNIQIHTGILVMNSTQLIH